MKRLRQCLLLVCFIVLLLVLAAISAFAEAKYPDAVVNQQLHLRVLLFEDKNAYTYIHEFHGEKDTYVLFLPADCDRNHMMVYFDEPWFQVDGIKLQNGEGTDVFKQDRTVTITVPAGEFSLRVISTKGLPSFYISTQSGSLALMHEDKSHRETGNVSVVESGVLTAQNEELSYIKGRGNSSWLSNEKRSYTLKFRNKVALFGMPEAKKWVLTSNTLDKSLVRNAIAYSAAKLTRLPYTVDFAFVDLFINGIYRGNYLLCEKVEVAKNRINIADLEKANETINRGMDLSEAKRMKTSNRDTQIAWCDLPYEPGDISGGYLLEYDDPEELERKPSAFLT